MWRSVPSERPRESCGLLPLWVQPLQTLTGRRADAALRDQCRHEARGCDIKRQVERGACLRYYADRLDGAGRSLARQVREFLGGPLLDFDRAAVIERPIDGTD